MRTLLHGITRAIIQSRCKHPHREPWLPCPVCGRELTPFNEN